MFLVAAAIDAAYLKKDWELWIEVVGVQLKALLSTPSYDTGVLWELVVCTMSVSQWRCRYPCKNEATNDFHAIGVEFKL